MKGSLDLIIDILGFDHFGLGIELLWLDEPRGFRDRLTFCLDLFLKVILFCFGFQYLKLIFEALSQSLVNGLIFFI